MADPATLREWLAGYFASYPQACDTVEGISWWLGNRAHSPAELQASLRELVAGGDIDVWQRPDGTTVYGVKRAH